MNHIIDVSTRLRGLRDALDLSVEQIAQDCAVTPEEYTEYESGKKDIPVSFLHRISAKYGVELTALLFGEEPKMSSYFLTRKGAGVSVERTKRYKYESLASGFRRRLADPFIVTVEPKPEGTPLYLNSHEGQEFNMVMEGRLLLNVDGKDIILNEGDSLYFDSTKPHGMQALDGKPVKFLAVIM